MQDTATTSQTHFRQTTGNFWMLPAWIYEKKTLNISHDHRKHVHAKFNQNNQNV
jgi:hypothetical protein